MYEPIRTKSVHTMAGTTSSDFPHRSREEELDIQLAGHLVALLAATDELRALAPSDDLDMAAERLAARVTRLRGGLPPVRSASGGGKGTSPRFTFAPTRSPDGHSSSRRPVRIPRPPFWQRSGWTRTQVFP